MTTTAHDHEGVLSNTTLPSLLFTILRRGETGVLTVREGSIEKSLYIGAGKPLFAVSNDPEDRLGMHYLKTGRVSVAALLEAVETSNSTKKRLGTVLVEKGLIGAQDLVEGVLAQVRNIMLSLFQWTRGKYRYTPGPLPTDEVITLRLNADRILFDGVRQITRWERIWEAVGPLDARYQAVKQSEDRLKALDLSPDALEVLAKCDQGEGLKYLCALGKMSDFEVCRLLWAFKTLGIVKRV